MSAILMPAVAESDWLARRSAGEPVRNNTHHAATRPEAS